MLALSMEMCHFVVLWCVLVHMVNGTTTQCNAPQTPVLKLSITSHRNCTGHWTSQALLEHESNRVIGQQGTGTWKVDLDQRTAKCENTESVFIVATVSAPPPRAGPNYELVPGLGYYKLHTEGKNWHDARLTCAEEGAHLAIMNSDLEVTEMKAIMARHPKLFPDWRNEHAYIGINDIQTEGKWVTIFGQPLNTTGFSKWDSGEPSNGPVDHCGLLRRNGLLHDVGCNQIIAFLCEQEL